MEVVRMEQCRICGKETGGFGEIHCGRCDKIAGAVMADLVAEFGPQANTV